LAKADACQIFEVSTPVAGYRAIEHGDKAVLRQLEIENRDEALAKRQYTAIVNLDLFFPLMRQFWVASQSAYDQSYGG
jgi:hypothetical protein